MARFALVCIASLLAGISAGPLQSPHGRERPEPRDRAESRPRFESRERGSSGSLSPIGRCEGRDNVFQPGQTYEYRYFGKAETGLGFSDSKVVGLAFDCHVQLSVPEPCEFSLKVSRCDVFEKDAAAPDHESSRHGSLEEEVRMMESRGAEEIISRGGRNGFQPSDKTDELTKAVSQFPIQAQVANGEIVRVIYEESEDMWVVNFKKGILDALQIRTDTETPRNTILVNGVHGLCPTKYTAHGNSESIVEDKDIDSCIQASKKHWELSPLTAVWNMSIVSTAMQSRSICAYKLRRSSHVEQMVCKETHRLLPLPWTSHIAAVTANVTTTLKFVRTAGTAKPMDRDLSNKEVTSILYEHENSTDIDREQPTENEADEILEDLVKQAIEGFDIGSPAVFDDFVTELRQAKDLTDLVQKVKSFKDEDEEEVAKYLLVQGLVQCNAPACLRALTTLIQSDDIPSEVFEPIVMALALTKQADPLFLAEITRMCEASPSRTCTLMVAALTNKLLTDEDEDADDLLEEPESREAIKAAIKFVTELLEDSKCEAGNILDKADEDDEATKTIIALKALGNLGSVGQEYPEKLGLRTQKIEQKIAKCMTEKNQPTNVTITAIFAVRKFVPTQFIADRLLNVVADKTNPHEVRTAAFIQGLRMVKDKTSVRNIVKVMESEQSEQIKAFMISHLRSVVKSEDPNYKPTGKLIEEVLQETGKSLPKTKARLPHSVHFELSKFYEVPFLDEDSNDFGAQVETTIAFTPKSYMPKCVHFNVSAQAWSEYVNILETGAYLQGTEDLVEKVLGPRGILAKSKVLRQVKETLIKVLQTVEDLSYKYLKLDNVKEYGQRAFNTIRSQSFEAIVDRILGMAENVDTAELNRILSHARNMDTDKILETIKRYVPEQSMQVEKVVEKLKRINLRDVNENTLVEVLEAFGIPERKARDVLSQISSYGVDINAVIRWLKRQDLSSVQERLQSLRVRDIQEGSDNVLSKVKQFLNWVAEKYNLPDLSTMIEMLQRTLRNPTEFNNVKKDFMSHRERSMKSSKNSRSKNVFAEDDEDEDAYESRNSKNDDDEDDEESLNKLPWGRNVKSIKRVEDDDDNSNDDDDEELDITAFVRIFGNEIGFLSLGDIMQFFDTQKMMEKFNIKGNWRDVVDGFDVRPTLAAKSEMIHHVTTGLGLPLQITLNVTGIATVHLKMDPQGNSPRQSAIEIEPSAAVQVTGGLAIDLPTIHKIEVVSNTTIASEFEMKVRLNIREKMFEMKIEKPDEELDILHIRHELKLVKDDEDFEPFSDKGNQVDKQKCLPDAVERVTGLKICAELETSTLRGSKMLSHGPHELRVSVQESSHSGPTDHYKFNGKYDKEARNNRFELNFQAPSRDSRREYRALINHDRSSNNVDMDFEMPDQKTPKMKIFVKNLADSSREKYGAEVGFDVETSPRKHYNASVTVIGKLSGYGNGRGGYNRDVRVSEMMENGYFNYTLKGSLQTPLAWVNVSTTTAKLTNTLLMEHNLTYFISEHVQTPILKKLRFPNSQDRHGVSKFVIRHGLKAKVNDMATDLQAFAKFLTFPLMNVHEPTFEHVSQIKIHRDGRHVALHSNTTWITAHHELDFLNASITANNLNSIVRLSEPAVIRINVSRNDWHIGGKAVLRKEASDLALHTELTAFANIPECSSYLDCVVKRLKTEVKCIESAFKFAPNNMEMRPHHHHKLRTQPCDGAPTRPKHMTVTIQSKLRQKSGSPFSTENVRSYSDWSGMKRMSGHFTQGQVWELKSNMDVESNFGSRKQMQSTTQFGNDIKDRETMINLFVIHNQTATNIPYSFDHFAQFMISREEGLLISVNTSIARSEDDVLIGAGVILQIDPTDKFAQIGVDVDSPFFEGESSLILSKPQRGLVQARVIAKTNSDRSRNLKIDIDAIAKAGNGKVAVSLKSRHSKVETDMKHELDLYSDNSNSDFDAGMEFDETDDEEETTSRGSRTSTGYPRRSDKLKSRRNNNEDSEDLEDSSRRRNRNVRSVRKASKYGLTNEDFDDTTTSTTTEGYGSRDSAEDDQESNSFSSSRDEFSPSSRRTAGVRSSGKHRSSTTPDYETSDRFPSDYESSDRHAARSGKKHSRTSAFEKDEESMTGSRSHSGRRTTTPDYDNDDYTTTEPSSWDRSGKKHQRTSTTPDYDNDEESSTGSSWDRSGKKHQRTSTTPDYDNDEESSTGSSWGQSGKRHQRTSTTPDYDNDESSTGSSWGQSGKKHQRTSSTPDYDNDESSTGSSWGQSGKKHRSTTPDYENTEDDSSVFGRKTGYRKTKSARVSKGSLWNDIFGGASTEDNENTSSERRLFSNRDERSQQKKHQMKNSSRREFEDNDNNDDDEESWSPRKGQKWTYKTVKSHMSTINPRLSSVIRIRSLDSEVFPTLTVETKATLRQVSIEIDVRDVPRALREVITPGKFQVKGQFDSERAFLKVMVGNRGEAGIELHVRSQREATGKIYDRGLTNSGETVHAQVTVTIPSDDKIQIKLKVDPESSSRIARHVRETSRKAYNYSKDMASDYSDWGMKEAKRVYSDRDHPFYNKYTKSYMPKGTMKDWRNEAEESGREYMRSAREYTDEMYRDEEMFGTSIEAIVRKINRQRKELMESIRELIRDTPLGEWVDALPSFERLSRKMEEVVDRHFSRQMQIIRSEKSCILMKTCDLNGSIRAIQQVTVEIARSTDTRTIRDLAQTALEMVKEFLVESIRNVRENARKNEAIRNLVGPLKLEELERKIERMQVPSFEGIADAVKTVLLVAKDLVVDRFETVDQDRDGNIVLNIPHPFKWSSFKEMPRFTESQRQKAGDYYEKTKRSFSNFSKSAWNDNVQVPMTHRNKPLSFKWSDVKEFPKKNMPTQTAMIFGDRHVMTFDGKVYAIPEAADQQCTYLLARGMKQKNFALVKDKDAVTITVPEMVISINEKNEVRVNNSHVAQLPLESPSKRTKVTLVGDTVEVESDLGLTVKVTGEKKVVLVELSMSLWDETAGLLGSNDNEESNDWEMPNGRNADSVEDFLNSYEVGKSGQCKLVKGSRTPSSGRQCPKSTKCAQLFGGSASPLQKCFRSVDPEEFKEACETESTQCGRTEADETVCNIVAAYRKACSAEDIETEAPEECDTCEGGKKENSEWTVQGNQRKVDAVVLVSGHREASPQLGDKIRSVMDTIVQKLKSQGGSDVRVALVGFGGPGVHKKPHTHTIDGQQFGAPEKFSQALRTMKFGASQQADALEATEFVLDTHDFRPEATKLMLVFGAEEKEFTGHGSMQEVQEKLTEQGIILTVFSKYSSEEIKDRDQGINFDGNIFSSKMSSSSFDPSSRSSSKSSSSSSHQPRSEMPRRKLSFLAKQSRGAVFQLNQLTSSDRSSQLSERAAQVIFDQVKREESMCKRCVCKETDTTQQLISACTVSAC